MLIRHAYVAASISLLCVIPFIGTSAQTEIETKTVRISDLDLTTLAGQTEMQRRVRQAADAICGAKPDYRDLTSIALRDQCRSRAIASVTPTLPEAIARAEAQRNQQVSVTQK